MRRTNDDDEIEESDEASLIGDEELDDLDEEFALGEGLPDSEAMVSCPYCGEAVEITLDPGGGTQQDYVEDCEVCCQPWRVSVHYGLDGEANVNVEALGE